MVSPLYKPICDELTSQGVNYRYVKGFRANIAGRQVCGRLICATRQSGKWLCGFSLWIHLSGEFVYVGLWGGRLFESRHLDMVPQLVVDLLGEQAESLPGNTQNVSSTLLRKYGLHELET